VVAGDVLLVPTGRAVPAAFRRADGEFLYFHLQANTKYGGSSLAAVGDLFFARGAVFDVSTGARNSSVPAYGPALVAAPPDGLICWHDGKVRASRWVRAKKTDRRGGAKETTTLEETWAVSVPYGGTSLVVAGKTAVSAGAGPDKFGVSTVDLDS
jgi:hypothetical protein